MDEQDSRPKPATRKHHRGKWKMGRPCKLTPDLTDSICEDIRNGTPLKQAALAHGVTNGMFHRWLGEADSCPPGRTEDENAVYVEFRDKVRQAEAEAEADLWERVRQGSRVVGVEKGTRSERAAAGRLALAALNTRFGRRYFAWRARLQAKLLSKPVGDGLPDAGAPAGEDGGGWDLSGLSAQEFARYQDLVGKARKDITAMTPGEFAELQSLVRKAKG